MCWRCKFCCRCVRHGCADVQRRVDCVLCRLVLAKCLQPCPHCWSQALCGGETFEFVWKAFSTKEAAFALEIAAWQYSEPRLLCAWQPQCILPYLEIVVYPVLCTIFLKTQLEFCTSRFSFWPCEQNWFAKYHCC